MTSRYHRLEQKKKKKKEEKDRNERVMHSFNAGTTNIPRSNEILEFLFLLRIDVYLSKLNK